MAIKSTTILLLAGVLVTVFGGARTASALTIDQPVTPEFVKEHPDRITVATEKKADGLIQFTITYRTTHPSYLVANTEVRDGEKVLFRSNNSAYVRENSATYFVTVAPERIANTHFELFAGSFTEANGIPVPVPGGIQYPFQLRDFAKLAETK